MEEKGFIDIEVETEENGASRIRTFVRIAWIGGKSTCKIESRIVPTSDGSFGSDVAVIASKGPAPKSQPTPHGARNAYEHSDLKATIAWTRSPVTFKPHRCLMSN